MELKLPAVVVTQSDLRRIKRELLALHEYFLSYYSAKANQNTKPTMPRMSVSMESFISENNLNLQDEIIRKTAIEFFNYLGKSAPEISISFASDPPASVLQKLIAWLREEIHPQLVLNVGVRPSIVGGCVIRTRAKIYDFSLAKRIDANKDKLSEILRQELVGESI